MEGGELFEVIQDKRWGALIGGEKPLNGLKGSIPGVRGASGDGDRRTDGEVLVRRLFSELVRAAAFLHACGVVHRDIKLESE